MKLFESNRKRLTEGSLVDQANKNQQEIVKQKQLFSSRLKDILRPLVILEDQIVFAKEVEILEPKIISILKKFFGDDAEIVDTKQKPTDLSQIGFKMGKIGKDSLTAEARMDFVVLVKNAENLKKKENQLTEIKKLGSDRLRVRVPIFPKYFEDGKYSHGSAISIDRYVDGAKFYDKTLEDKINKIIKDI